MQTLTLRKPLKTIPNLDRVNLITKYNNYLRLINSGFFRESALAMVNFNSYEEFKKAENYFKEI
ncbi:hypothetical protein HZR84_10890 [Hyphobacterium sp. CCMP332]|nr:hypothetical protein HZR84_10890 [Hyphobacterium sp. CCMP332]